MQLRVSSYQALHEPGDMILFYISCDEGYTGNSGKIMRCNLGVAARNNNACVRVRPDCSSDKVSRLVICPARDSACVDYITISLRSKRYRHIDALVEHLQDARRFILVDLATQG